MSTIMLEAELRTDIGRGASRRLRRLENKVPAVVYGGTKAPQAIFLLHNKLVKALETESIYSSVFDVSVNGKTERVILKDLQRHPYKPVILHMDLQRVSAKDVLVKMIPLHFLNEEEAKGVKEGGMINHSMTQVEVRCQAQHLPAFIEVDVLNLDIDEVLHLSDIKLPKGVDLTVDLSDISHDHPVVSIHIPRVSQVDEEAEAAEEAAAAAAAEAAAESTGESAVDAAGAEEAAPAADDAPEEKDAE